MYINKFSEQKGSFLSLSLHFELLSKTQNAVENSFQDKENEWISQYPIPVDMS